MAAKKYFLYAVVFVFISMITQALLIAFVPNILFAIAKQRSGKPLNTVIHAPATDAKLRKVVLPNPDFIYSAVFYDISDGDLHITAQFPDSSQYASMAFYDTKTQPYFVMNNMESGKENVDIILSVTGKGANIVHSPTSQGVVLMRFLVKDSSMATPTFKLQKLFRVEKM